MMPRAEALSWVYPQKAAYTEVWFTIASDATGGQSRSPPAYLNRLPSGSVPAGVPSECALRAVNRGSVMCAGREDHLEAEMSTQSRYPRGWAGNAGFAGWKIAVAFAMLLGVPATIWLLVTLLFR